MGQPIFSGHPVLGTLSIEPVETAVPEPGTLGILAAALAGFAAFSAPPPIKHANAGLPRPLTGGVTEIEVEANNFRRMVLELDSRYPGLGRQIEESMPTRLDHLGGDIDFISSRSGIAIAPFG